MLFRSDRSADFVYDIFLCNDQEQDIKVQAVSIGTLKRLNLVNTSYRGGPTGPEYARYDATAIGRELTKEDEDKGSIVKFGLLAGRLSPTSLGISFWDACSPTSG